jgi:hypothetical protein
LECIGECIVRQSRIGDLIRGVVRSSSIARTVPGHLIEEFEAACLIEDSITTADYGFFSKPICKPKTGREILLGSGEGMSLGAWS